jgi:hypothetical protein
MNFHHTVDQIPTLTHGGQLTAVSIQSMALKTPVAATIRRARTDLGLDVSSAPSTATTPWREKYFKKLELLFRNLN